MKPLFLIFISFSMGWMLHILFTDNPRKNDIIPQSTTNNIDCSSYNELYTTETVEKVVIKEVIKFVPKTKIIYKNREKEAETNSSTKDMFFIALKKDAFFDAMEYYQDADEEKHELYKTALSAYFDRRVKKEELKTIEEMQYFIEIESECRVIVFQLASIFEKKGAYNQALNLIIDFSYASDNSKSTIHTKIKSISLNYIRKLTSVNNFSTLIEFLINRINVGFLSDFYSFELAKIYLKLKKYTPSVEILEELQNNTTYKEEATEMLAFIQNKLEEQEEYPVQIPLIKDGLHFLVKAYADGTPLLLMIDTGASITTIDSNKISHLQTQRSDVLFHTAGGDIRETIFQADNFSIGLVSLENFKIAGTQFAGSGQDGLLGMNFLGKFKFKIDQKEAILFLGEKN